MSSHSHHEHTEHKSSAHVAHTPHKKKSLSLAVIAGVVVLAGIATWAWTSLGHVVPDMSFDQAYRTWTSSLTRGMSGYSTYIENFSKSTENLTLNVKAHSKDIEGSLKFSNTGVVNSAQMQLDYTMKFDTAFNDKKTKQAFTASGVASIMLFPDMIYATVKEFGIDSADADMIGPMVNTYRNKTISMPIESVSGSMTPVQLQKAFPQMIATLSTAIENNVLFVGGSKTTIQGKQAYPVTFSQSGVNGLIDTLTKDPLMMEIFSLDPSAGSALKESLTQLSGVSFSGYLVVYGADDVALHIANMSAPDAMGAISAVLRLRDGFITIEDTTNNKETMTISWEGTMLGGLKIDIKTTVDGKPGDVNGRINVDMSSSTTQMKTTIDGDMRFAVDATETTTNPDLMNVSFELSSTVKKADTITITRPTDVLPFAQLFGGMEGEMSEEPVDESGSETIQ